MAEQGVALVERVIDYVRKDGLRAFGGRSLGEPRPLAATTIEGLRFPNGERPSPSLARWLAFDASWVASLGWFADLEAPAFARSTITDFAKREYEETGGYFAGFAPSLPGDFYLLPEGSDSRRALYVGRPDSLGEHPVLVTDNDDLPYVAVMYPGFDVFVAHFARLLSLEFGTYEALNQHPDYRGRMAEHRENNLGGKARLEFGAEEEALAEAGPMPPAPPVWEPGQPAPEGYRILRNPFTGQATLMPMKK